MNVPGHAGQGELLLRASYCAAKGLRIHQWDQQQRRRKWHVVGTYVTPQGEQEFEVKTKNPCWMKELVPLIETAIREDVKLTGSVEDIKWTAIGR